MLTNKGKYGLKALLHLARLSPGETAQGADIARANRIPKKFLDAIMTELRKDGLVRSRKGPGGGYALARSSRAIMIGDIVRTLDGPLAPIRCASLTAYAPCEDCVSVAACAVRIAMREVRDAMADVLDNRSLADLAKAKSSRRKPGSAATR
jgi:Rrf2 family protein